MLKIVCTEAAMEKAREISSRIEGSGVVKVSGILSDPQSLGDFDSLGLVFEKDGRGIGRSMATFITEVLSEYDLSSMDYMFSVCVCSSASGRRNPSHALKIVEKLCAGVGCAPSLSAAVLPSDDVDGLVRRISDGDIALAKGTPGTMFYMKAHGMKIK